MKSKLFRGLIVATLVLVLAFGFAACTPTTGGTSGGGTSTSGGGNEDEEPTVTKLEIVKAPDKTQYDEGATFDTTGMELKATWSHGEEEELYPAECEYSPKGALTTSVTEITFTYEGASCKQSIVVKTLDVGELAVDSSKLGTIKAAGTMLDLTQIKVMVNRSNGETEETTSYELYNGKTKITDPTKYVVADGLNTITVKVGAYEDTFQIRGALVIQSEDQSQVEYYKEDNTRAYPWSENTTTYYSKSESKDGTAYSITTGADGTANSSLESARGFTNGTVRFKANVQSAGKYRLVARVMANTETGGLGLMDTAQSMGAIVNPTGESSTWGSQCVAATNKVLPGSQTTGWVKMLYWTIVTIGEFDFNQGENQVVVQICRNGVRTPNIDWFMIEKADAAVQTKAEVLSYRANGLVFEKGFTSDPVGTNDPVIGGLFMRIPLADVTTDATYYDAFITGANLKTAGFDTSATGIKKMTVYLTLPAAIIDLCPYFDGEVFVAECTYVVVEAAS